MTSTTNRHRPLLNDDPTLLNLNSIRKRITWTAGTICFRQRLTLSLLSGRPVVLEEIRSSASDLTVGLAPHELNFAKLLLELSNGSKLSVSETGTRVSLHPGVLVGGHLVYTTDPGRPLSYYLEPILLLAPFCKKPLDLTLRGRIQNDGLGFNSVYKLKHAALPILELFGLEPDLQVLSRSSETSEVKFTCTVKKALLTLRSQLSEGCGKIKKVRGLAYGFRVSPQMLNRLVSSAKGIFLPFLSDVYITTDQVKGSKSKSPGFGLVLNAITTKNIHYAADGFVGSDVKGQGPKLLSVTRQNLDKGQEEDGGSGTAAGIKRTFDLFAEDDEEEDDGEAHGSSSKKRRKTQQQSLLAGATKSKVDEITSPEELGVHVAKALLREISTRSTVDSVFQWLVLGLMALSPKDVSSVLLGQLTPFTVQFLRDLKTYFGITFKVETQGPENEDEGVEERPNNQQLYKLSCLGSGYMNLNKTML